MNPQCPLTPPCDKFSNTYCPVCSRRTDEEKKLRALWQFLAEKFRPHYEALRAGAPMPDTSTSAFFQDFADPATGKFKPVGKNFFFESAQFSALELAFAWWLMAQGTRNPNTGDWRYPSFRVVSDYEVLTTMRRLRFADAEDGDFAAFAKQSDCLVIRLGVSNTSDPDLAGAIHTLLQLRVDVRSAKTVIVNESVSAWNRGHKCYTPELDKYLFGPTWERIKPGMTKRITEVA